MTCQRSVVVQSVSVRCIRVEPVALDLCTACQAAGRCRSDWLSGRISGRAFEISVPDPTIFRAGDTVRVEVSEAQLMRRVFALFGAPLGGLILASTVSFVLDWSDGLSLVAVSFGVVMGWVVGARCVRHGLVIEVKQ